MRKRNNRVRRNKAISKASRALGCHLHLYLPTQRAFKDPVLFLLGHPTWETSSSASNSIRNPSLKASKDKVGMDIKVKEDMVTKDIPASRAIKVDKGTPVSKDREVSSRVKDSKFRDLVLRSHIGVLLSLVRRVEIFLVWKGLEVGW